MTPWWVGLAPAQTTIACGEERHRVRWEQGALQALDHDDPEAERALAALGGQRCACVDVLDAWADHETDPRVLVLASRGPADPLAAQPEWTGQLGSRARPRGPLRAQSSRMSTRQLLRRRSGRQSSGSFSGRFHAATPQAHAAGQMPLRTEPESELVALLGLAGGVSDRLVATVAAAWAGRWREAGPELNGARPSLQASMHGRLMATARGWLGRSDLEVTLELIEDGRPPHLGWAENGALEAELPFAWMPEVWSRGLAVFMGRFCLSASTEDGRTWTLSTVGPDLGSPATVRLDLSPS